MLSCLNLKLEPTLLLLFRLVGALLFQLDFADDAKAWQNLVSLQVRLPRRISFPHAPQQADRETPVPGIDRIEWDKGFDPGTAEDRREAVLEALEIPKVRPARIRSAGRQFTVAEYNVQTEG